MMLVNAACSQERLQNAKTMHNIISNGCNIVSAAKLIVLPQALSLKLFFKIIVTSHIGNVDITVAM
jgi:hypothetical protein